MVSLGFDGKNSGIFQMITELDSDGNGNIDFGEFFSLMTTKISDKNNRAQYSKIFSIYDAERKGYITAENLVQVAATLGETISVEEINELIKRADSDHDGVVSEEEFYAIMTRALWLIDLSIMICEYWCLFDAFQLFKWGWRKKQWKLEFEPKMGKISNF